MTYGSHLVLLIVVSPALSAEPRMENSTICCIIIIGRTPKIFSRTAVTNVAL